MMVGAIPRHEAMIAFLGGIVCIFRTDAERGSPTGLVSLITRTYYSQ
jgi:hypothetical protein